MKKIILAVALLIVVAGCYNDKYDKLYPAISTTVCDTTSITYTHDVQPIIASSCYSQGNGCHDAAGSSTSGYDYTNFATFQGNALSGWIVSDINFTPTHGHNNMPKNCSQLSSCDINKITRWVNEGAPNN